MFSAFSTSSPSYATISMISASCLGRVQLPRLYHPAPVILSSPTSLTSHETSERELLNAAAGNANALILNIFNSPPLPIPHFTHPGKSKLGLGILSASKQCYAEGNHLYWGENTVFLQGPLAHTMFFFGNILPWHQNLINHLGVYLSLADLTPQNMKLLERDFHAHNGFCPNKAVSELEIHLLSPPFVACQN